MLYVETVLGDLMVEVAGEQRTALTPVVRNESAKRWRPFARRRQMARTGANATVGHDSNRATEWIGIIIGEYR